MVVKVSRRVTLAAFLGSTAVSALFLGTREIQGAADGITYNTFHWYTIGSYGAWMGMFYTHFDPDFKEGEDFTSSIKVFPETFPNGSVINWRVPDDPPSFGGLGIYGYLHVNYGNYDEGPVQMPITSRQVYEITDLATKLDYSFSEVLDAGNDGSSILHEFWLTAEPTPPGAAHITKLFEVGCFPHVSAATIRYVESTPPVGTFVDSSGRSWDVVMTNDIVPFIMFKPTDNSDIIGTIHWKEMLTFLTQEGAITGNEYFNGIAIGVEPRTGNGSLNLTRFEMSYAGAARTP